MLDDNELLFDELYEKTKDCGRVQFINLLMEKEREKQELKKKLGEQQYYKFYKYDNNPKGSDYCFCQRPCDSNMSLHCFLDNGEILGFMSESLVYKHPEIKEIDMNEFMHGFIKPLIKENQQLKEQLEASERARKEAIDEIKELYDNTDDTTCYDIDKDEKERLLQILDIDKGE